MRKDPDVRSDRPALVVTYGNTTQRHRPLEKDLIILGRARNCDIALVSPEVAAVHCIIARVGNEWQLRDCTGRGGTRLNGSPVNDVVLTDSDVLQVGTFSFEVKLPATPRTAHAAETRLDDAKTQRLGRSRRNLAHLALELRKRLRVAEAARRPQEELDRQADRVRTLQRECETRRGQHEQAEAALRALRETQERELSARREELDRAEQRLAQQRSELETRAQSQQQQLEEQTRQAEQLHRQQVEALQQLAGSLAGPPEALLELQRFGRRLTRWTRKLQQKHVQLQEQACQLAGLTPANGGISSAAEVEVLRVQVDELRLRVTQLQTQAEVQEKELTALRALEDAQAAVVELSGGAQMQELINSLRQQVKDRDALLEKMNQKLGQHAARPAAEDMAGYEAELNQYRIELERDRRELNQQMADVQERQEEMEHALREAELQMARERAQLAREQAELNRLRMELSRKNDRRSREIATRKRLAGVQRLKEEVTAEKSPDPAPEAANGGRFRNLLSRLTGSSV